MTTDQWIVLAIAIAAAVAFVSERIRSEVVALCVLCALAITGVVTPRAALSGFASEAVAAVAAMFVLSAALGHSGALQRVTALLVWLSRARVLLLAALMPLAGALSAFVNNTAIVAVLLPSLMRVVQQKGWSPSKFLIPLSYASQFGGVCTLIGTSTNLLVHSLAVDAGLPGFTMFEFTTLGLSMLAIGTVYMLVVGQWLLPDRGKATAEELFALDDFVTELEVEGEALVGKRVEELDLQNRHGLVPLDLVRGEKRFWRPKTVRLELGDVIRVSGAARDFTGLGASSGLALHAERFFGTQIAKDEERRLVEAMVPPQSSLVGHSAAELGLPARWNAVLLAIRRHGEPQSSKLARVRLESGDILLLMTTREGVAEAFNPQDLVVLSEKDHAPPRTGNPLLVVAVVAAAIALAAIGWLPIHVSALAACAVLLVARTLSSEEAIAAVDWRVLVLIAGMLPLGLAMQDSGLAKSMVDGLFALLDVDSPAFALALIYLITAVLTEMMSNNAAAVLLVPVALSVAEHLGVDAKPFLVAVAFAASTSFATPVGYQTNTMVYNAGNYRFADFARIGVPLNLLFWGVASVLIPILFPF
ncbi:MAG TPA: SLC13 family permease [Xanthomonadales bacterium]|nr:SLC13 family permease [Xanthomonadales bacterium]